MTARAMIFGCEGTHLTAAERDFFKEANPWGFILFSRNIETPEQIRALTSELRSCVGRDAPILIDQEGGRVQRLRAPHWREWPAPLDQAVAYGDQGAKLFELRYQLIGAELRDLGIDVNCAPMLDVPQDNTHEIITNRCYGYEVEQIITIGRAVADGLLASGVLPIVKHIPGHGRASADSHLELPRVDASRVALEEDFTPFKALADLPMAMTAHIEYSAIDPDAPATQSGAVIEIIRNDIEFSGLLMTDDLSMEALAGGMKERVVASLGAGCDMILHCNGKMSEMLAIAEETPELYGDGLKRADHALSQRHPLDACDQNALWDEYSALLRGAV